MGKANEVEFRQPADFYSIEKSTDTKLPIMVLFSSQYCVYCDFIKREYLSPMLISGDYTNRVIIKVVETDEADEVRDFNGKVIDSDLFAGRYNVQFTPTVVFIDARGRELATQIVGLGNEDFYGGQIDEGITQSHTLLRAGMKKTMQ